MRCNKNKTNGFTLLEVLVAFVIAAIALVTLMKIFSDGVQLSGKGEDYSRATILAESLLTRAQAYLTMQESPVTGVFDDRFNWTIQLIPYPVEQAPQLSEQTAVLVKTSILINWKDGTKTRSYNLSSLRLTAKSAP